MRAWFSGITLPCQGKNPGSTPGARTEVNSIALRKDISIQSNEVLNKPLISNISRETGDNYVNLCIKDKLKIVPLPADFGYKWL